MDAVLQRLLVEVHVVAYLAVLKHEICVELLLEELAVLGDAFRGVGR